MTSKPAIYDLDSDDEDWVFQKHILDDDFESIVDALKKTYHYNPDDCCDEIVSKKIVEVVHGYWMRKGKHNHSSLLSIFEVTFTLLHCLLYWNISMKLSPCSFNRDKFYW
ncbi:putative enhancer of polycomb protein [Medicago truncatula]|uniref:Putative enhancer of polycomb protein n=1 Tax=Medicago truncatula TaxID=3880 RepID=A0A396JUC4_MEDTR|nr:putative enhancer of polycomb protein [Medicago truncatula]